MKMTRTTLYRLDRDTAQAIVKLVRPLRFDGADLPVTDLQSAWTREGWEDYLGRVQKEAADRVRRAREMGDRRTSVQDAEALCAAVAELAAQVVEAMDEEDAADTVHLLEPMRYACTALSRRYGADRSALEGHDDVQARYGGALATAYYRLRMAIDPVAVQMEEIQSAVDVDVPSEAH